MCHLTRQREEIAGAADTGPSLPGLPETSPLGLVEPASEPEDREHERGEEDLRTDHDERRPDQGEPRLAQRSEPARRPLPEDDPEQHQARDEDGARQEEPVLEPEARAEALEGLVVLADEVDAVRPGAQPEADRLRPEDDQQAAKDQRVDVEARAR